MKRILIGIAVVAIIGAVAGGLVYKYYPNPTSYYGGLPLAWLRALGAPEGTLESQSNPASRNPVSVDRNRIPAAKSREEWPSYNRTLISDRYSPLSEINRDNAGKLKVLCSYDVGVFTAFESGLIMVNGALIGTTQFDTFSIDPDTCEEKWRVHESYPRSMLGVNRGAAYLDGRLFRGTQDGRVLAYDFETGERLWETRIADPEMGETVPSAPIAWNGMVYVGQAGGDYKGVKGRAYGLDAATGKIAWEFYLVPFEKGDRVRGPQGKSPLDGATWGNLPGIPISGGANWTSMTLDTESGSLYVPGGNPAPDFAIGLREGDNLFSGAMVVLDAKTGDYRQHYGITTEDWHDWDVSNPPILIQSRAGRRMMIATPKDGHVYGFDLATGERLYRVPATRIMNADAPMIIGEAVRFCPGVVGGAEWNSPAYDPSTNLVLTGQVDWCYSVTLEDENKLRDSPEGQPWMGSQSLNPLYALGTPLEGTRNGTAGSMP